MDLIIFILVIPFMLFYTGGKIKSHLPRRGYYLSASVFTIGLLFRVNHFPYSIEMIMAGIIICLLIYGFNFINTRKKHFQAYLLLAWLLFLMLHFVKPEESPTYRFYIANIAAILLWLNIAHTVYLYFMKSDE